MNNAASLWTWWHCKHTNTLSLRLTAPNLSRGKSSLSTKPSLLPSHISAVGARGPCLPSRPDQTGLRTALQRNCEFPHCLAHALGNLATSVTFLKDAGSLKSYIQHILQWRNVYFRRCVVNMCCSAHLGRCWRCTLTLGCLIGSSQTGGLAPGSASSWTGSKEIKC